MRRSLVHFGVSSIKIAKHHAGLLSQDTCITTAGCNTVAVCYAAIFASFSGDTPMNNHEADPDNLKNLTMQWLGPLRYKYFHIH